MAAPRAAGSIGRGSTKFSRATGIVVNLVHVPTEVYRGTLYLNLGTRDRPIPRPPLILSEYEI